MLFPPRSYLAAVFAWPVPASGPEGSLGSSLPDAGRPGSPAQVSMGADRCSSSLSIWELIRRCSSRNAVLILNSAPRSPVLQGIQSKPSTSKALSILILRMLLSCPKRKSQEGLWFSGFRWLVFFFPESFLQYSKLYYSTRTNEMIIYKLYILSLKINVILVSFKKNPCANFYIILLGFTCGLLIWGKGRTKERCGVFSFYNPALQCSEAVILRGMFVRPWEK